MDAKTLGIALLALCPLAATAQQADPAPVQEYENLLREIQGLREYNALRQRQIDQQQSDIARVETAMDGVPQLKLELPPLLIRMVDGLKEFVDLDFPLLVEQRTDP